MTRVREFGIKNMAVLGRTSVSCASFANLPELDDLTINKIDAVTLLVANPLKFFNFLEPKFAPFLAGVNQLYAENEITSHDTNVKTENNRVFSFEQAYKVLLLLRVENMAFNFMI